MIGHPQAAPARWPADRSRPAALWLFAVAVAVLTLVVVGGATRLTGSGLSITQWKPILGALPPLSPAQWGEAFHRYQATPQYQLVNHGMSLARFKSIFWWEWAHRLLARTVGVLFALPLIVLVATRRLPRRLTGPCVLLFFLGAAQGVAGWWMVRSGLEARVSVAPERLSLHLGLALVLFCALIWFGLEAWAGPRPDRRPTSAAWRWAAGVFVVAVFVQCLLGALVAGNHAGLVNGDWPLMSGRFVPTDYWRGGWWSTLAHGVAAVQFNHRLLAYALLIFAVSLAVAGMRSRAAGNTARTLCLAAGFTALLQALLGIALLARGVPLPLALLHQATAAILLAIAVALAWSIRRRFTVASYHVIKE